MTDYFTTNNNENNVFKIIFILKIEKITIL